MEPLKAEIEAAVRAVLEPRCLYWKNDSGARELEQLPQEAQRGLRRGARERQRRSSGSDVHSAAGGGAEDRLVLRSGRQPRTACALCRAGRAGAGCLLLRGRLGGERSASGRRARALRGFLAARARVRRRQRERNGVAIEALRGDAFDVLKDARASTGERFDIVILDPPAFIKRKKDIPQGQAAYRKLNQLAMGVLANEGLLVSCSCSYHLARAGAAGGHPGGRAPRRPLRAGARQRRPVRRSPGPPGDPRNPLPQGLLLPRDARCRLNFAPHAYLSWFRPDRLQLGPVKVHWYGIMYLLGFAAAWWLGRVRAARPGSTWKPQRRR